MSNVIFRVNEKTYHKGNNDNCFNYVNALFSDFDENIIRKNVNISMTIHY